MTNTLTDKQTEKLESMIGDHFMYNARNIVVKGLYVGESEVKVITDSNPIVFGIEETTTYLKEFLPVSGPPEENNAADKLMNKESKTINTIEEILSENIKKLQGDDGEKFIARAREITSTTNAIVKLNRLKLDMIKETRKINS